jgi:hypothetical protein
MQNDAVIVIICAALIAFVAIAALIGWIGLGALRARAVLRAWEAKSGFKIVRFEPKNIRRRGPFSWWTTSRHQIIYHLRVLDREGRERLAWVRLGSYFGGIFFSNKAELKWDQQ